MTISLRSVLVVAPVLGLSPWPPAFQAAFDILAKECEDCLEEDGSHGDACAAIGCHPEPPPDRQIASLTLFLASSTYDSAKHHFDCFDGDGNGCTAEEERENNTETIRRSLERFQDRLTLSRFEGLESLMSQENAGITGEYRPALRTSVADAEQPQIVDNFDKWVEHIETWLEHNASLSDCEQVAINDEFEPLDSAEFKEFLSELSFFDFDERDPTQAETLQMMKWFDGFLDATHELFFEYEKAKDNDGDDETLYDQTKDVLMGTATRNTFSLLRHTSAPF